MRVNRAATSSANTYSRNCARLVSTKLIGVTMPNWIRTRFRDPQTSFASAVTIMSLVGLVCGVIGIARILLAMR